MSLPALDYAGAVSECALRREGEGRSPMDPLRVTGSVGRGVKSSRLCGIKEGATFPRGIGGVIAPMPVGPFVPESKTGVPKIAERGAPGRFTLPLIRIDGPALRAPLISSKTRAKAAD